MTDEQYKEMEAVPEGESLQRVESMQTKTQYSLDMLTKN